MGRIKKKSIAEIEALQADFYGSEVPGYIVSASEDYLTIKVSDVLTEQSRNLKITITDVVEYYKTQARSMSGIRTIAGHVGDWRPIDNIAKECLEWFKFVNRDKLAKLARKEGMELRN